MSVNLLLSNLATYSLQIGLLVGIAALLPALLRLRAPAARLAYWHVLLAACLILPLAAPRRVQVIEGNVEIATSPGVVAGSSPAPAAGFRISLGEATLAALAAGAAIRIGWLLFGFAQLSRYRRRSRPLEPAPSWSVEASLRLSDDVVSPVTFGWRKPVVLLPANFPDLSERLRDAILAHECLHVRRRDWLFTLFEEFVRAVFWFHPAIWWLLGEIQLAREQAVDRAAVDITNGREEYVDALLAIAGAPIEPDLAPAPLFLRKRHLKQRVFSLIKEVPMSKKRLVSALAACLCIMAAACWYVAGTFPLSAAPQVAAVEGSEVKVDLGGAALLHRAPVVYPTKAAQAGIRGTVVVEAVVDGAGNVADARVLSGPAELRSAALQSVLQWHFAQESASSTRQVSITFQLPETAPAQASVVQPAAPPAQSQAPASATRPMRIAGITTVGLSDAARAELLAALPVREGDLLTKDVVPKLVAAIKAFDEHLSLSASSAPPTPGQQPDSVNIRIVAPTGAPPIVGDPPQLDAAAPQRIRVGGNVQQMNLVSKINPTYPPDAKAARVQGHVALSAIIAKDGTIRELKVVSGHPLLVQSALDSVKQWVYKPTLVGGNPVEVVTDIDVNYTLSQ